MSRTELLQERIVDNWFNTPVHNTVEDNTFLSIFVGFLLNCSYHVVLKQETKKRFLGQLEMYEKRGQLFVVKLALEITCVN